MIKGLQLYIIKDDPLNVVLNLERDFFNHIENLEYIKPLCSLFDLSRVKVNIRSKTITFINEDGSEGFQLSSRDAILFINKSYVNRKTSLFNITDVVQHSKTHGYAHKFNKEAFLNGDYTQDVLDFLKHYELANYSITAEVMYSPRKNKLIITDDICLIEDLYE